MVGTPVPPITTLGFIPDEDPDTLSQSWRKPFGHLLFLLKINVDDGQYGPENHCFCFQHTHDLSELSRTFLSVSIYPGITYEIAIDGIRFNDSDSFSGQAFLAELEDYADRVLSRVRVSIFAKSHLHNSLTKFQDYSSRLIEMDIIHDASPFHEVDLLTCPLCHSLLRSCQECDAAVACPNHDCAGSQVVDCKQCDDHDRMTCHECLDSEEIPSFVHCPTCNSWCCRRDMDWCPGHIISPPLSKKLVKLSQAKESDFDSTSIVRSHSPMPGPCRSCIDAGHTNAWQACSAIQTVLCPSRAHSFYDLGLNSAYCPECITEQKGQRCVCGTVWLCDACSVAEHSTYFPLISCPRCGAAYCTKEDGCRHCYFCKICRQSSICFSCQALEKEDAEEDVDGKDMSDEDSQPSNAYERCLQCRLYMCNECCSTGKDGVIRCSGCQRWVCGRCSEGKKKCRSCFWSDIF